jgi:anti-sigma regulatory factor (Ser/Thr protein kinase)
LYYRRVRQVEVRLVGEPTSVADARRFVIEVLEGAGIVDEAWTATQVVSELATNAIVHADTDFVVRVSIGTTALRIAVTDYRPFVTLVERPFSATETTGRGLRLVDTLSCSWGVHTAETSKTVWCDIPRTGGGCGTTPALDILADVGPITGAGAPLARA